MLGQVLASASLLPVCASTSHTSPSMSCRLSLAMRLASRTTRFMLLTPRPSALRILVLEFVGGYGG